jgi:hypothetical protein
MRNFLIGAMAFAVVTLPAAALAQTTNAPGMQKAAPNSGAGVPGMTGSKSGPAAKPGNTGAAPRTSNTGSDPANAPDAAKIPGKAGSKSGPAVKPPSSSKMK